MNYWWVNHKQTHRAEIDDGYIWSPKTKANGAPNQTYTNLTLVQLGDVVFSYAGGLIRAIGIATGMFVEEKKPSSFGAAGNSWADDGWRVPIEWQILKSPIAPKAHLSEIARLLPSPHSPIRKETGDGNQGCYLASIGKPLGQKLQELIRADDSTAIEISAERAAQADADELEYLVEECAEIVPTEIEQVVKARRGQGRFRLNVLKIEKRCRLTLVEGGQFLVASHIKPWTACNNAERLDGHNGLLLAPHVDRLFDRGFISFSNSGILLVANKQVDNVLLAWKLPVAGEFVGVFTIRQQQYLEFHRANVFQRAYLLSI